VLIVGSQVGAPEKPLPAMPVFPLILTNKHLTGSAIGAPGLIKDMLELAASHGVKSWVEERPMEKVNETLMDMEHGKARYRYVLINDKHKNLARG
jgi:alcohol dehydrogenase (NADP+)